MEKTVDLLSKSVEAKVKAKERIFNVALASTSELKRKVVESFMTPNLNLTCVQIEDPNQIEQPLDHYGLIMARNRVKWVLANHPNRFNAIIAIENYIELRPLAKAKDHSAEYGKHPVDQAIVLIYVVNEGLEYIGVSQAIELPDMNLWHSLLEKHPVPILPNEPYGLTRTYGSIYHEHHPDIPANNWMAFSSGVDRFEQIRLCMQEQIHHLRQDQAMISDVLHRFRYYPDFPIKGVNFLAWDDIFLDSQLVKRLIKYLAKKYQPNRHAIRQGDDNALPTIKYVAGLETRGYLLAIPLAQELGAGFVPMRKPGKLPDPKVTRTYTKEYGTDTLEMRSDLEPGAILVVDDILATGGSLNAAAELAEEAGHTVIDCIVIRDVPPLRKDALKTLGSRPVRVVIGGRVPFPP